MFNTTIVFCEIYKTTKLVTSNQIIFTNTFLRAKIFALVDFQGLQLISYTYGGLSFEYSEFQIAYYSVTSQCLFFGYVTQII